MIETEEHMKPVQLPLPAEQLRPTEQLNSVEKQNPEEQLKSLEQLRPIEQQRPSLPVPSVPQGNSQISVLTNFSFI